MTCNGFGVDGRVQSNYGAVSTMLGSINSLSSIDLNQTLYLSIEIGGTSGSPVLDGEMSPRKIVGTVPASFESKRLNGQVASYYLDANNLNNFVQRFGVVLNSTTTDALSDGLNHLYFSLDKARSAIASNITGVFCSATTGIFTLTSGYKIPKTASTSNWNNFYLTPSSRISLSSGLTWSSNTIVIDQNSLTKASATEQGVVSTSTQEFSRNKTLNNDIRVYGTSTLVGILGGNMTINGHSSFFNNNSNWFNNLSKWVSNFIFNSV